MQPGEKAKITKRTFLNKGVFIFTGATVEILDWRSSSALVLYHDKEGHPHELELLHTDLEKP